MATITGVRHHTRDEVKGYIDDARAIVAELELDGDLKPLAFVEAVRLLSGKVFMSEQPAAAPMDLERLLGKR